MEIQSQRRRHGAVFAVSRASGIVGKAENIEVFWGVSPERAKEATNSKVRESYFCTLCIWCVIGIVQIVWPDLVETLVIEARNARRHFGALRTFPLERRSVFGGTSGILAQEAGVLAINSVYCLRTKRSLQNF